MEAYSPYLPQNTLKPVATDVWIVDGPEIEFGYLGVKVAHPTRMTVVRLADGRIWIHSPTQPTDSLTRAIESLGPVSYLVAPNTLHYWWIPDWHARFTRAECWGPPGLQRSAKRDMPSLRLLDGAEPPSWSGVLAYFLVRGNVLTEAAFFHRPTRTLILTDLIENFELSRVRNRWLKRFVKWSGVADQDGKTPLDMALNFLFRRYTLRAAVRRMIDWNPERVILAHGRWFDSNGASVIKRLFRWVL